MKEINQDIILHVTYVVWIRKIYMEGGKRRPLPTPEAYPAPVYAIPERKVVPGHPFRGWTHKSLARGDFARWYGAPKAVFESAGAAWACADWYNNLFKGMCPSVPLLPLQWGGVHTHVCGRVHTHTRPHTNAYGNIIAVAVASPSRRDQEPVYYVDLENLWVSKYEDMLYVHAPYVHMYSTTTYKGDITLMSKKLGGVCHYRVTPVDKGTVEARFKRICLAALKNK